MSGVEELHIVVADYCGHQCAWSWATDIQSALAGGDQQNVEDMEGMTEEHVLTLRGARARRALRWLQSDTDELGRIDRLMAALEADASADQWFQP